MTKPTTDNTPADPAPAVVTRPGRIAGWLTELGLGYVLMLTATIGGLVWLAAIHLVLMRHGPALMLAALSGLGSFAGMCRARSRATAVRAEFERDESEVKP